MSDGSDFATDEAVPPATLPLDAWHRAKGGRMVEFAGYWMPIQYEGIMAEHLWVRENAGLFDVSHMGQLSIAGDDAAAALEALVPGDIAGLKPGRMRYSLLLSDDGGILDDLMITNEGAQYGVVVNGAVKWDDIAHLREALPDDITLNHNEDYGLLALQGPKAAEALARLVPDAATLVFMQAMPATWNGHAIAISRSGYTGEDGFEISLPNEALEAFADALCAMDEVKPIGLGARDSLRLEAGLPLYGHDLDPATDPVEGDLGFAISKRRREEANFPGAARILGHLADGAPRKRVGLLIEGKMPVREGATLFDGDTEIGVVTSGGFAPSVGAPIAMGYVPTGLAAPGTAVAAEVRGKRVPCTVTAMPFIPHNYVRKQGG
ncbi:glycine cleavage system aminomethyltransferase GcvT [Sphingopyxis sp. YF1]|uniref:glycine cleavage system aminomethyltransferase GcvT n=1 Tax=Sphingopyxis sp. YF1 TaxID=2482763 RepID=UPI001F608E1B|nr:glycine cleavage system aminomethyltransferase GcvT [Sphingopyxis sp. YF1]UNU41951.1 glycine cleavage system aminomethyltransferase GcvT [Sphingopyxis sp. YF1]